MEVGGEDTRLAVIGWCAVGTGAIVIPVVINWLAGRRGALSMSRTSMRTALRPVAGPVAVAVVGGPVLGLGWHLGQVLVAEYRQTRDRPGARTTS